MTIETVRFAQAWFISQDAMMVDSRTGHKSNVQASNMNEALGQIDYILTDKTGTLTKNYMEFKKMHIGTQSYGHN